jgi:DNA-binding CsgD family transcriptional regulator
MAEGYKRTRYPDTNGRKYKLICPMVSLEREMHQVLNKLGWCHEEAASFGLIYDVPWTVAFKVLDVLSKDNLASEWVVITNNPCPEAALDLWDAGVRGVIVGGFEDYQFVSLIEQYAGGKRTKQVYVGTCLTRAERRVLHHVALGRSQKGIANSLRVSIGTVKTHLRNLCQKLHLKNSREVMAYYAGLWHLLANYGDKAFELDQKV